jgi:hypothetical protein
MFNMSQVLDTRLNEIRDANLSAMIVELEAVCLVPSSYFLEQPLRFYLNQCVYPKGAGTQRVPISTASAACSPLLETRIGKLSDGPIFDLCMELSMRHGTALEFSLGKKLVTFLNLTLPKFAPVKAPSKEQRLKNSIVHIRRNNR